MISIQFDAPLAGAWYVPTIVVSEKGALEFFAKIGSPQWYLDRAESVGKVHWNALQTAIDEGLLYIISGNGMIGCHDAKTGGKKWSHTMREYGGHTPGWGYSESVLIWKDRAIVTPGGESCIVALNKKTGEAYGVLLPDLVGLGAVCARAAFVIDRQGVVRYSEQTPSPKELPNFAKVKETLAALA